MLLLCRVSRRFPSSCRRRLSFGLLRCAVVCIHVANPLFTTPPPLWHHTKRDWCRLSEAILRYYTVITTVLLLLLLLGDAGEKKDREMRSRLRIPHDWGILNVDYQSTRTINLFRKICIYCILYSSINNDSSYKQCMYNVTSFLGL